MFRTSKLKTLNPETTAFMERRLREAAAQGLAPKREQDWVPLEQVSVDLVGAVIVAEDPRFFLHAGIDWIEVKKSMQRNLRLRRFDRGASTITQQLAKNLYLSPSKSFTRKLREIMIAREMERTLGKRRILEIYLNVIEWGDGIYGAEAAARFYFGTTAAELDADQSAFLSAIIPAPRKGYQPATPPEQIRQRIGRILHMLELYHKLHEGARLKT